MFRDLLSTNVEKYRNSLYDKYIKNPTIENKFLNEFLDVNSFLKIHNRRLYPLPSKIYPNGICLPGVKRTFVDINGNFHICEKINSKFRIGSVEKGYDLDKIFRTINEYVKTNETCKDCWCVRFYNACYALAIEGDNFSIERKCNVN